jgi:dTDP-glucose 4,6-dehydratase
METNTREVCLISGVSGFIASHALEYLLEKTDWNFICPASWRHKGTPERITEILKPEWRGRVTVITHDLTVPFTDITISRLGKIDYILNFASESHVDRSITDPVPFIQNNVNLTLTLLELARKVKPKVFVQISTDEVYGTAPDGISFKEWSEILPSNPYAASKAAQEAIAIAYWRTYDVPVVITNTTNNFGERQDTEKYLGKLIAKISRDEVVTVHGSEKYIGGRFYTYVKNHASAILHIIQNNLVEHYVDGTDRQFPARFNVTSDDEVDNLTMAKMVAEIMGRELHYELIDVHATRPGHDRRYALDVSKLKETGWKLEYPLQESLKSYIQWTMQNQHWS